MSNTFLSILDAHNSAENCTMSASIFPIARISIYFSSNTTAPNAPVPLVLHSPRPSIVVDFPLPGLSIFQISTFLLFYYSCIPRPCNLYILSVVNIFVFHYHVRSAGLHKMICLHWEVPHNCCFIFIRHFLSFMTIPIVCMMEPISLAEILASQLCKFVVSSL